MSGARTHIQAVDVVQIPVYPISTSDRLDSHFFLQWNLKRWRASDLRKTVDPDVGWYALNLFFVAQDQTPIGTLPTDEAQLAFDLHLSVSKWRELMTREVTPLHNWSEVQCDNGEIRLGHPVVTEIAVEALGSKRRNAAKNADDRMRKRLRTISKLLSDRMGQPSASQSDDVLNQLSDWIEKTYPGGSATERRVKEAWDVLSTRR